MTARAQARSSKLVVMFLCVLCGSALGVDRNAFTFTEYHLQAQIAPAQHGLAVGGEVTLRNDSPAPRSHLALQISSSLNWISIKLGPSPGRPLLYVTHAYTSDIDHTGALSEAVVTLPQPVAPGASITLEVTYSGQIMPDATRLERMGTPKEVALANDWDQISPAFTAVRGVGYVAWYPVAMEAVSLADGRDYSLALGEWRSRQADAEMRIDVPAEGGVQIKMDDQAGGVHGSYASCTAAGTQANPGGTAPQTQKDAPGQPSPSTAQCSSGNWFAFTPIGERVPAFYAGDYSTLSQGSTIVEHLPGGQAAAQSYAAASRAIQPLIAGWLAESTTRFPAIQLVQLPAEDAPFESGDFLFTPLQAANASAMQLELAPTLAHACFHSRRPWLAEGVAEFMQALTRERQLDRQAALDFMAQQLPTLVREEKENQEAAADPAQPLSTAATSLITASDELLYRSKAMYVWWMLRDLLGDSVLKAALAAYQPQDDRGAAYMQHLLAQAAAAQHVAPKMELEQFFDDWVYRDRGLPDFTVKSTYARKLLAAPGGENYMTTVTLANLGNAGAVVPVTVSAGERERVSKLLAVPARGEASIRISTASLPTSVSVNDGSVPESDLTNNRATVAAPSE